MFGIGLGELILIIIVALLFISPEKLPEIAGSVVKAYREIRRAGNEFKRSVTDIEGAPPVKKEGREGGGSSESGPEGNAKGEGKGAQGGNGAGDEGSGQGNTGSSAS